MATSENFQPVFQNFLMENDHIAESDGYIINIRAGGYKIGEKKFYQPSSTLISLFPNYFDKELFKQLLQLKKRIGKNLFRKILRATELFFQAYYNNPNVSAGARILLVAAAFETLLDLEENGARKDFKNKIEKYVDVQGEIKYRHYYSTRKGKKRDKNRSIKVLWADSFFELRNQIIHGDYVSPKMYVFNQGDRHINIAVLFFSILIKELINEKLRKRTFEDKIGSFLE